MLSIFRQKMDGTNLIQKEIKVLTPVPTYIYIMKNLEVLIWYNYTIIV